jgi:hypothetical protein
VAEKRIDAAILIIIVVVIAAAAAVSGYYIGSRGGGGGGGGDTGFKFFREIHVTQDTDHVDFNDINGVDNKFTVYMDLKNNGVWGGYRIFINGDFNPSDYTSGWATLGKEGYNTGIDSEFNVGVLDAGRSEIKIVQMALCPDGIVRYYLTPLLINLGAEFKSGSKNDAVSSILSIRVASQYPNMIGAGSIIILTSP